MNFKPDDAAAGGLVTPTCEAPRSRQILVVDDSREVREFVALLLARSDYQVLMAADGAGACEILQTEHPVLVISDLEMPGGNGWDLLTYCHARHPHLPVLLISGGAYGRRPEVEAWAAGRLRKPFDRGQFHAEVHRLTHHAA